jgi:hypothetical protein
MTASPVYASTDAEYAAVDCPTGISMTLKIAVKIIADCSDV